MKYKCQKCGYEWSPRTANPVRCANKKCRCRQWNRYELTAVEHPPATEKGILHGKHYGRLLITMTTIETYGKRYAELLKKSESQISTMLNALQSAGIVSKYAPNHLDSPNKPIGKKKQWRINKNEFRRLCQEHAERNLKSKSTQIINSIVNPDPMKRSFLRLEGDKIISNNEKDKFIKKIKDEEFQKHKKFREQLADNIKKISHSRFRQIQLMFKEGKFEEFIKIYVNAFYPDLNFSLAELTDFYIEWGEELWKYYC